ncbi:DUF6090 family protein [Roseivirga sp.]|uniref:DUF6090 family protein n=1 Tax=Roseivirga sp. TaxID=1964215 RepID=UPI003B8B910B
MEQKKVSKYLLYAVSEIMLVVIGIYIAIQFNNWNEGRKSRHVELQYFYNLKNDLNADLQGLDKMIELSKTKVSAAQDIKRNSDLMQIGSLYTFNQDLQDLTFVDEFRPNDNTYEEMKSSGHFSTMSINELKLNLMNLKKTYSEIAAAHEHIRNDYNVFLEDLMHHIDLGKYYDLSKSDIPNLKLTYDSAYIDSHKGILENEVRDLFKNKVFLNNIYLLEINYTFISEIFSNTKVQVNELIEMLEKELDQD